MLSKWVLEIFLLHILESEKYIQNYKYRFDLDYARTLADESRVNLRYMMLARALGSYPSFHLRRFRDNLLNSPGDWEAMERTFSTFDRILGQEHNQMSTDQRREVKLRLFQLAELISTSFDEQQLSNALASILALPDTKPINLTHVVEASKAVGVEVEQILADFLLQEKLPGTHFSAARQAKLETPDGNDPAFITVIDFRNVEDVSANVSFEIAELAELDYAEQATQAITRLDTYGPFHLTGETSYRLFLKSKDRIGIIGANTYLSLNRGKIEIPISKVPSVSVDPTFATNDQSISLARSEWNPFEDENVIFVDDLDPGFEVLVGEHPSNRSWWNIEARWLRSYEPKRKELDNGLPSVTYPSPSTHTGVWARSTWGGCWGRYRPTYVFAPSSLRPVLKATFTTELPRAGRWVLSYHFPDVSGSGDYNIGVRAELQSWDLNLMAEDWDVGWTELATFDIESPERVEVSVSTESNAYYVYADAIKWKYSK